MYFLLLYLLLPSKQTSTQRSTLPNSLGICCSLASAIFLQLKTRTSDLSNQLFFPLLSLFHCIKAFHWKIQVRYRPEPLSSQCRRFDNKYPVGNHYTSWGDLFDSKIGGTESDFENRGLDNLSSYELKICTESLRTFKVFDVKTIRASPSGKESHMWLFTLHPVAVLGVSSRLIHVQAQITLALTTLI